MFRLNRVLFDDAAGGDGGGGDGGGGAGDGGGEAGNGGPGTADFLTTLKALPDGMADAGCMQGIDSVEGLVKNYISAQTMIGSAERVPVLGDNPDPEAIKEYREKMGIPEDVDGYELPTEGLPEGTVLNKEALADTLKLMHDLNLPKTAVAKLLRHAAESDAAVVTQMQADSEEASVQATTELKKEWGGAYDDMLKLAQQAAKNTDLGGGEEFWKYLADSGMGNNVQLIKFLAKTGKSLLQDEIKGLGSKANNFALTPADADAKITQMRADPAWQKRATHQDPNIREAAEKEMSDLYNIKKPEPAKA